MIEVHGFAMRVWTEGIAERQPGEPVVVFENGGGAPIEGRGSSPSRIAGLAPVIAYDRSTVGESAWDGLVATPERLPSRLRALLGALGVAPPYILVGWSHGGGLVRHHVGPYPDDIAGVV
jgi:pimeloyl-ACP methyl ester carboxylesterase